MKSKANSQQGAVVIGTLKDVSSFLSQLSHVVQGSVIWYEVADTCVFSPHDF